MIFTVEASNIYIYLLYNENPLSELTSVGMVFDWVMANLACHRHHGEQEHFSCKDGKCESAATSFISLSMICPRLFVSSATRLHLVRSVEHIYV